MTNQEEFVLREYAGGRATAQKVVDELGPMSLWSKDALDKHVAEAVAAAVAAQVEKDAKLCEEILDMKELLRAEKATFDCNGESVSEQLRRFSHHSTVGVYNAGIKRCAAAIRAQCK